jgi:hypothetical protein
MTYVHFSWKYPSSSARLHALALPARYMGACLPIYQVYHNIHGPHTGLALTIILEILAFVDNLAKQEPHSLYCLNKEPRPATQFWSSFKFNRLKVLHQKELVWAPYWSSSVHYIGIYS